ncbi:Benzoate 4-monooxygenase [Erysiphe neolycopersici]|uniref:Benzoate 4-monooxygenase n=1 Tax=Erysiphe neolycopersici TaxID=212602 RepID=A0A420HUP7_9PEZI|nr:Benzoate 4-monooxygenase [Erysiphe neolycopersici]
MDLEFYISALLIFLFLYYVVPFLTLNSNLRDIPGPLIARFSHLWLLLQARLGRRYQTIEAAHKKYGKLVRIQPNHISIADDSAIIPVYGHSNGLLKSEFYTAFVFLRPNLFNTLDRDEHSRKRKPLLPIHSVASVHKFEKKIHENLRLIIKQWDKLAKEANNDYAKLDCMHWLNLLAFDIIGDVTYGKSFNLLKTGQDIVETRNTPDDPPTYQPVVEVLNRRGDVSATLGCFPQLLPFAKYIPDPFFTKGLTAVNHLNGIAVARVAQRFKGKSETDGVDILTRLMQGNDEKGENQDIAELVTQSLTQVIAGSDTTSNTSCAIFFWVLRTPHVLSKLQAELDAAIPENIDMPSYDTVKDLSYLTSVIKETLRIHSTSSIGLPRVVPPGPGVTICSRYFPAGTVLSVPSYTIHHSPEIWGEDVEEFVPERWSRLTSRQKSSFFPFSHGPRACIGRNLAMMQLHLMIATLIRRYDFILYSESLETREGFIRKPIRCMIGLKKRVKLGDP